NPFVTRIELDQTKRRIKDTLREEIKAVDDKNSENHVVDRELLARSNTTMEHLIKSSDRTTTAVEKMTDEIRESEGATSRKRKSGRTYKNVRDRFRKSHRVYSSTKRNHGR